MCLASVPQKHVGDYRVGFGQILHHIPRGWFCYTSTKWGGGEGPIIHFWKVNAVHLPDKLKICLGSKKNFKKHAIVLLSLLLIANPPCWFWKKHTAHLCEHARLAAVRNPHVHQTAVATALNKPVQTLFLSIPKNLKDLCAAASPAVETLQAPQETLSVMRRAHVDSGVPIAACLHQPHP